MTITGGPAVSTSDAAPAPTSGGVEGTQPRSSATTARRLLSRAGLTAGHLQPTRHRPGLTGPGGTLLGVLLVGIGCTFDLGLGSGLGACFAVTFLLAAVAVPLAVRLRALGTAAVLPPLLFAGAELLETKTAGQTTGMRAQALDVATSLALSAPLLFVGTVLATVIALGRVAAHVLRR